MYTVRQERFGHTIAKWGDRNEPEEIYSITERGCSCPAGYRRRCKHFKLVDSFKSLEPGGWAFEFRGSAVQPISWSLFEV